MLLCDDEIYKPKGVCITCASGISYSRCLFDKEQSEAQARRVISQLKLHVLINKQCNCSYLG